MKLRILLSVVAIAALGGVISRFSIGQDPFGASAGPRTTVVRSIPNSGDETVNFVGADIPASWAISTDESKLRDSVSNLAKQLKGADGAQKDSLLTNLKSAVSQQFDNRQEGKAKELKALEEQLAKLREIHTKRTQQKDLIVAERVQQILREADGLGWGSELSESSELLQFPGMVRASTILPYRSLAIPTNPIAAPLTISPAAPPATTSPVSGTPPR